ncbi:galactose mutarotase [Streptomyces fagopyri]|uniref:Aldose 1-epimerase n=1 Tax=Streptomyces fagopyri TaxID=2662397 RepID=A0A5Q0L635_9ACTN|nr:aldose epimerase family protein [Streptomyces fagopyri]QFZ72338.1 galactose mutarotase [Streptomyces fagopyri]
MNIRKETVGSTRGHAGQSPTPVDSYTLDTGEGLTVVVWTYGASTIEVLTPDRSGRVDNTVVRLPDLSSYQDRRRNPYVGATLGRYCRVVGDGTIRLDGVEHELDRNEGKHHVHGGGIGFDRYVWEADAERRDDELLLHLSLVTPDGDQGYPGTLSAEVIYRVDRHRRLTFEYQATSTAPTVVGLTNHAFWNLAGSGTVDQQRLAVNADRAMVFDGDLVPLPGPPAPIAGTALDYREPRPIGDALIDNCFVLDDPAWAAELYDPAGGRAMRVTTDQPGLGVYSADKFTDRPRAGLCLEAGALPDPPGRNASPFSRLDPGEVYRHRTTHEFLIR